MIATRVAKRDIAEEDGAASDGDIHRRSVRGRMREAHLRLRGARRAVIGCHQHVNRRQQTNRGDSIAEIFSQRYGFVDNDWRGRICRTHLNPVLCRAQGQIWAELAVGHILQHHLTVHPNINCRGIRAEVSDPNEGSSGLRLNGIIVIIIRAANEEHGHRHHGEQ